MYHTQLSTFLWMGDLDEEMDDHSIINAFAQFGEAVVSVKIIKNKSKNGTPTKFSKYYCFVEFADVDTAQNVLHKLNGKYLPGPSGKRFKLNPASYGREHELLPEFSLYVGDLSYDIDDYELFAFFQKRYKSVRGAKVVVDVSAKSKGYGFIRFSEETDQQRALVEMQHMTGLGRRPIKVSLASIKRPNEMSNTAPTQQPGNSSSSYYAGAYSWGGYAFHYNQSLGQPAASHPASHGMPDVNAAAALLAEDDSEVLEDPCLEINIGKENREFIESSESFFQALEHSRWQPLDNVMSDIPD